jgi:hypothetical protein
MKMYGGNGTIAPLFFTSALKGSECSATRPHHFILRETVPGTRWVRGWTLRRREKPFASATSRNPALQPAARRYTD